MKMASLTSDAGTITLSPSTNSSVSLSIPSGVTVSGMSTWDGTIAAPVVRKQTGSTMFLEVGSRTSSLQFSTPVALTVKSSLPEGTNIDIYSSHDGNTWEKQGVGTVVNGVITITTTHFTFFALSVAKEQPNVVATSTGVVTTSTGKTNTSTGKTTTTPIKTTSTSTGQTAISTKSPFKDIDNSFAREYVLSLYGSGIVHGYSDGTFRPDRSVSRIEFLKMAMIKMGRYSASGSTATGCIFVDAGADWQKPLLQTAYDDGIITGYTEDDGSLTFSPDLPITRAEALKILFNTASIDVSSAPETSSFVDVVEPWMIPYIETAKSLSIINGQESANGPIFRPDDTLTRAESAKILFKTPVSTIH